MHGSTCLHHFGIKIRIAIRTQMAAGIVLPYIHALHTAALLTLIGILANIYPAPQNLFQPSLVNALTMPDTAIRQIYF